MAKRKDKSEGSPQIFLVLGGVFSILMLIGGLIITGLLMISAGFSNIDCGDSCAPGILEDKHRTQDLANKVFYISLGLAAIIFLLTYIAYRKNHKPKALYLP